MADLAEVLSTFFGVSSKPTIAETFAGKFPGSITTYVQGDATGATDSTAALNTAIAAAPSTGGYILLGPGTYTMNSAPNALPANCTLIGAGEGVTTINTSLGSGTWMALSGAISNVANLTINNTAVTNTAAAFSISASQVTMYNVAITGFGSTTASLNMTSGATFAQLYNIYLQSSVSNAVGLNVAGADTLIQGCVFNGFTTGMTCAANDRFAVIDNVFKSCTTGISLTATTATGSTTFDGLQFDACTTGVSIAPGTGAAVQAAIFDGCVFNGFTTGVTLAPTSTGTVTYVALDGCSFISTVNSATALTVNGAGANSVQYITVDGCDFVASGTSSNGFTYTAGGNPAAPITFVNCDFNSTTNLSTAVGSANNLPFVVRGCPGVNPVGKLSSQPATSASAVTNNTGADVMVALVIGGTGTTVSVGGQSLGFGSQTSVNQLITVPYGQTITTSQTTGVSWTWFGS